MEIQVLHVADVGTRAVKGPHVPDHGEGRGEGAVGGVEGDVKDGGCVYDLVNGFEGILGWRWC